MKRLTLWGRLETRKKVGQKTTYSPEFKAEAIRLMEAGQKTVAQLARELGVARQQLHSWQRQAQRRKGQPLADIFPGKGHLPEAEAELQRLKRENAQLKEDNEILKKAAAFFAKHQR